MNRIATIMAMGKTNVTPPSPLLTNLISYWKLDEASGARADSHGSNNLTDNNTVGSAAGIINNCADFISTNSEFLSHASNASLEMSGNTDFSISGWVKITTIQSQSLITKDDDAANSRDYTFDYLGAGGLRFYIKGGSTYICDSVSITIDTWHFIVAWYDSSNGQLHLRIDDTTTYNSVTGATGTDASAAQFRIGAREYLGFEDYSDALIDEVGIWKRVLSSQEITDLYNSGAGLTYPFQ